jgi:thioredoxin reductase
VFGRGLFHCPYCDGWEVRGEPLAAYGRGNAGLEVALELTGWSDDVVLCTDGPAGLSGAQRQRLARHRVALDERRLAGLEGDGDLLARLWFTDGTSLVRRALFFPPRWKQRSHLAEQLGCRLDEDGLVPAGPDGATQVPGLYVAGDCSGGIQLAIVAAAEGARAALSINRELLEEDRAGREAKRPAHAATPG